VPNNERTVLPTEDTDSFLRNPAMGWAVYIDAFEKPFPDADLYWEEQDPNLTWASILYIRVPWSQLEPEEGSYAWREDANYRQLIRMALERGLKLAFRVYVDSKDAYRQATPQYVFEAGAKGYVNGGGDEGEGSSERLPFFTPYVYDAVFQDKFSRFVRAFAAEYDDPGRVDFIDGQGLGWWGEMHNVRGVWGARRRQVFEWIVNLYCRCFRQVLLGEQYGRGAFSYRLQDWALRERGYMIRRDSFGSPIWLKPVDKRRILRHWPAVPVFAENCYHTFAGRPEWYQGDGFGTLRAMMERVIRDAKELHANTLDLRNPGDAAQWMAEAPDLVRDFALRCGYRFVLTRVTYPEIVKPDGACTVNHAWKNEGFGKLPNHLANWGGKYKVAFALLDRESGRLVCATTDENAEPADWLYGAEHACKMEMTVQDVPAGVYDLAVGIVNTSAGGNPEIRLAICNRSTEQKWYVIGDVQVINY